MSKNPENRFNRFSDYILFKNNFTFLAQKYWTENQQLEVSVYKESTSIYFNKAMKKADQ